MSSSFPVGSHRQSHGFLIGLVKKALRPIAEMAALGHVQLANGALGAVLFDEQDRNIFKL